MPSTAPLDLYIRRVLNDPKAEIFQRSSHLQTPTLVRGRINRILAYRGCFNPPHQGHKDALVHAFFRGGHDLNIIAAIVIFLDDGNLHAKYNDANETSLVLSKYQRIKLFNNGGLYGGFHWCFDRSVEHSEEFKEKLQQEAARDGFCIRFVLLSGPDWLGRTTFPGETIVVGTGDAPRMQYRAATETGFSQLPNYDPWKLVRLEENTIQQLGSEGSPRWLEQKLEMLFPKAATGLPIDSQARLQVVRNRLRTNVWRLGNIRICDHWSGDKGRWIRFVPTRYIDLANNGITLNRREVDISSTAIRNTFLRLNDERKFLRAMAGVALSPERLWKYLREIQRQQEKQRRKLVRAKPRTKNSHAQGSFSSMEIRRVQFLKSTSPAGAVSIEMEANVSLSRAAISE